MIKRDKSGYCVVSKKGKRLGGPYKNYRQARKRMGEVEYFKKMASESAGQLLADNTDALLEHAPGGKGHDQKKHASKDGGVKGKAVKGKSDDLKSLAHKADALYAKYLKAPSGVATDNAALAYQRALKDYNAKKAAIKAAAKSKGDASGTKGKGKVVDVDDADAKWEKYKKAKQKWMENPDGKGLWAATKVAYSKFNAVGKKDHTAQKGKSKVSSYAIPPSKAREKGEGSGDTGLLTKLQQPFKWHSLPYSVKDGVLHYTSNGYSYVNEYLRGQSGAVYATKTKDTIAAMDKALIPTKQSFTVYRGLELHRPLDKVGKLVRDDGFVSTSISENVARSFAGLGKSTGFVAKVMVQKGHQIIPIGGYSSHSSEREVILKRGTVFKLTKVDIKKKVVHLTTATPRGKQAVATFTDSLRALDSSSGIGGNSGFMESKKSGKKRLESKFIWKEGDLVWLDDNEESNSTPPTFPILLEHSPGGKGHNQKSHGHGGGGGGGGGKGSAPSRPASLRPTHAQSVPAIIDVRRITKARFVRDTALEKMVDKKGNILSVWERPRWAAVGEYKGKWAKSKGGEVQAKKDLGHHMEPVLRNLIKKHIDSTIGRSGNKAVDAEGKKAVYEFKTGNAHTTMNNRLFKTLPKPSQEEQAALNSAPPYLRHEMRRAIMQAAVDRKRWYAKKQGKELYSVYAVVNLNKGVAAVWMAKGSKPFVYWAQDLAGMKKTVVGVFRIR